jgi:hypothetical protein
LIGRGGAVSARTRNSRWRSLVSMRNQLSSPRTTVLGVTVVLSLILRSAILRSVAIVSPDGLLGGQLGETGLAARSTRQSRPYAVPGVARWRSPEPASAPWVELSCQHELSGHFGAPGSAWVDRRAGQGRHRAMSCGPTAGVGRAPETGGPRVRAGFTVTGAPDIPRRRAAAGGYRLITSIPACRHGDAPSPVYVNDLCRTSDAKRLAMARPIRCQKRRRELSVSKKSVGNARRSLDGVVNSLAKPVGSPSRWGMLRVRSQIR